VRFNEFRNPEQPDRSRWTTANIYGFIAVSQTIDSPALLLLKGEEPVQPFRAAGMKDFYGVNIK
jgi:hypothetical protein